MLSKNNQVLARHAKADHQQRWALRKLTIGVASVLLGGTLLVINGTPVAADQVNPENATTVKSEPEMSNTKQDAENVVTLASTASDRPAVNATSGEQSPAGVGAEAMLATPAASPALSDPSVTPPQQPAALASDASGQMQPAVTKLQAPEMGWRKPEDSDRTVSYYVIVREVTLVKPDGEEVVMPLLPLRKGQVWDTLDYLDKEENDKLPLIHFDPIKVAPITGAKAPVIPAISQSVHSFLTTDLDKIEISYVIPPVQRTGMEVTPLPYGPEYDEIYDEIYDQYEDKATEYEKKIEAEGRKFGYLDVLLLKETYEYIWVEEKTITRTIHVHLPNGEVQTTKQPVTLERKYTSVAGSDEKKYGPWTVGRWESFTAPEQEGYTALSGSVDEAKVTSESLDAVVDIYYRADEAVIESGKEEKTITRTIHVHLPNGEVQTTKQPVTLVRQYTSVAGSDEKNYGPWNTGQWDAFTAPEQTGYTALPGSVAEIEVTSESLDAVVDIYYRADDPAIVAGKEEKTITRTIHVHLPNGEVQTTKQPVTLERKYTSVAGSDEKKYGPWTVGRWESFTAPEQEGYTALSGSVDEAKVTSESLDAVVDIYYRADEAVIESGKEEKTITRTIHVHLPNGEVQTTKQPVTLVRQYTSVAGSDEKNYGPWNTGQWDAFTAPEQTGYTALPGSVAEIEVTSESLDAVVDIYYRADDPAIVAGKEEKTITRTINVHLPNGEVQTTKQPVTLEREYTSVVGSDEKKYGPWTVGRWESFTAPEQAGYTALPGSVAEVEVTSESLDAVVDIYYRADDPAIVAGKEEKTITRTIHVHLPNDEVQTTKQPVTLERKYTSVAGSGEKKYGPWTAGRWESFTAPEQEGYTALPGSVAEVEVTSESLDAVVDIYYRADEAVIESGQEEKTITRTINVHLPNGEVQTTTQPVTLVREYTGVAGSDEKNYGPWNTGQWNAFTAPELAGYTAMPGSVASVEVTSESLDVVVDIYYRIDIPPKVEVGPDPEQPTTDPDPEQPMTDPDPEQPMTDPDPEQPTTDPDPEQPTTDPDLEQPIGHPVAPATVAPDQQANLPQTGNATSSLVALLGATLATFLGSLLLLGKRKR